MKYSKEWREGWDAYLYDKPHICPAEYSVEEKIDWLNGWDDAARFDVPDEDIYDAE